MKVSDALEILSKVSPDAELLIAGYGDMPEVCNKIFVADDKNSDGEWSFCDLGVSMGDKAVLMTNED